MVVNMSETTASISLADGSVPEVVFPPLTLRQKAVISVGNAVDGVSTAALGNFQFFYLTVVCGLSGSLAGASVFIALTVDAVADPLIGSLSDNWASRHGRRHPIMIASILPVALSIGLFFSVPLHLPAWGTFVYVTAVLLLHRIGYSVFTLPYQGMVAEISHDYVERSVLRVYGAIATSASAVLSLWLGYRVFLNGASGLMQRSAYIPFGWACALIIAACAIVCCFGTLKLRGRMLNAVKTSHSIIPRLGREIVEIFKSPSFRVIFFTALVWFIASGVFGALALHASKFFWRLPTNVIQAVAIGLPAGSALASEVCSWAMIVVSPRSTVTRLVAPRNVVASTVPVSGPASADSPEATLTASGRTRATTCPAGMPMSTSGSSAPRTTTVPDPVTSPASRLDRPTNSATKGVAGRL